MKQCTITFEQDGRKAIVVITDNNTKVSFAPPMDKENIQVKDFLCLYFLEMLKKIKSVSEND